MTHKQIYLIMAVVVLVLILFGIYGYQDLQGNKKQAPVTTNVNSQVATTTANSQPVAKPKAPVKTTAPTLTKGDAVKQYQGRRIQFNGSCQAQPTALVLKTGSSVMLDNASAEKRIIKVGGKSYTIAAYGFTIAILTASKSPATLQIDCGGQYNVAQILLQQ